MGVQSGFLGWPEPPFPSSELGTYSFSSIFQGGRWQRGARHPSPAPLVLTLDLLVLNTLLLAVTALLFKMEEANLASRAKAQELIQATNQVGSLGEESSWSLPSSPDSG